MFGNKQQIIKKKKKTFIVDIMLAYVASNFSPQYDAYVTKSNKLIVYEYICIAIQDQLIL